MFSPMLCTNSSTWADTVAPAVGKMLAFSSPSSLRTMLNSVLLMSSYSKCRPRGGRLPRLIYSILCLRPMFSAFMNTLRSIAFDFSIFSITPMYTFSQNLGTALMLVGCVSRMVFCTSWG